MRNMSRWGISFLILSLLAPIAFANQLPRGLATDERVKVVAYNRDDIVSIHGSHLVSTAVFLNKNEKIINIDIGDQLAWEVSIATAADNVLFIKPKLPRSDTNLTVLTDKRAYQFHLFTHDGDHPKSRQATYSIQFTYPDEEKIQLTDEMNNFQKNFLGNHHNDALQWNYAYSFYGSKKLAPIQAVDNGTFTVFKFSQHTPIPAIFAVDARRHEAMVNGKTQGDYVFIQGVRHQYTLRNGEEVTTVYNDHFNS